METLLSSASLLSKKPQNLELVQDRAWDLNPRLGLPCGFSGPSFGSSSSGFPGGLTGC